MNDLQDKVAFITGAGSKRGIGHAVAIRLAQGGYNVALTDKYEAPTSLFADDKKWRGLPEIVEEIRALGREALSIVADVIDGTAIDNAVAKTIEKYGKIDVLVNCAGTIGKRDTPVVELSLSDWMIPVTTNLTGSFLVAKAVSREMIKRKQGKILMVSSIAGRKGNAQLAGYSASKFGVIGLVQSLALELAPYNINVNAICPGPIVTNLRDLWLVHKAAETSTDVEAARHNFLKKKANEIPLGRLGEASEVAELVFFLVSERASFITGQSYNICGGSQLD